LELQRVIERNPSDKGNFPAIQNHAMVARSKLGQLHRERPAGAVFGRTHWLADTLQYLAPSVENLI